MPICAQRAKEACKAVIKDDFERARLLGRHDIIKVLESEFLSEDDSDAFIVEFLKSNVAGEIQSLFSATTMHGDILMTFLYTFVCFRSTWTGSGSGVDVGGRWGSFSCVGGFHTCRCRCRRPS